MKTTDINVGIAGIGVYYPETKVHTLEEARKVDLPDRVYDLINVKTIFKAEDHVHSSHLSLLGAERALEDANMEAGEIDLIIASGIFKDFYKWKMSNFLKDGLGAKNAMTIDVDGGCAAFYQSTELAFDQIRADTGINTVLIASGERLFGYGWPTFLSSGGQAIILKRGHEDFNYLGFSTSNLIEHHEVGFFVKGGTEQPFAPGMEWHKKLTDNVAVDADNYYDNVKPIVIPRFKEVAEHVMGQCGVTISDIDYMVTVHQQHNLPDRILKELGRPDLASTKDYAVDLGHFSGADNYITLDLARSEGKIKKGDLILNLGLGACAWFASLIKY